MAARFEWDEKKDRSNSLKHGIGFAAACDVFYDLNSILRPDRYVDGEERWQTIGRMKNGSVIALVVHTIAGDTEDVLFRIISARKATPGERRLYEEGN